MVGLHAVAGHLEAPHRLAAVARHVLIVSRSCIVASTSRCQQVARLGLHRSSDVC